MQRILLALACGLALAVGSASGGGLAAAERLQVVTTIPDLRDLARQVGGEAVDAQSLVAGADDPHAVEARPGFIRRLAQADLFVAVGLDLEAGWVPALLRGARNARVNPGAPGFVDASQAIEPLGVAAGHVDRGQGDVHPHGNPHYLLDPLNGLRVAALLRDRIAALRPDLAEPARAGFADFRARLLAKLVGAELAQAEDAEALVARCERGDFAGRAPGGWLGRLAPSAGARAVADHDLHRYLARRFGFEVVGFLEPRPGIPPTTRHLAELVELMKARAVRVVLAAPYAEGRNVAKVAEAAGARVARIAHQVGALPGTDDYLAMVDANVEALAKAFAP